MPFRADFKTTRAGDFGQGNKIKLHFESGLWKVEWTPAAIFKELTDSTYLVHMFISSSTRGSIYAVNKVPLTANGKQYEVYVVPGQFDNEDQLLLALSQTLKMGRLKSRTFTKAGSRTGGCLSKLFLFHARFGDCLVARIGRGRRGLAGYLQLSVGPERQPYGRLYINKVNADDLKTLAVKGYTDTDIIAGPGRKPGVRKPWPGLDGKLTIITSDGQTK